MREVTGSSPVVPTRIAPPRHFAAAAFFSVWGQQSAKSLFGRARHGRKAAVSKLCRGDPFRGVGRVLLSPPKKCCGVCRSFFVVMTDTEEPVWACETWTQGGRVEALPRGPLQGCRQGPVVPTKKMLRCLPQLFCGDDRYRRACLGVRDMDARRPCRSSAEGTPSGVSAGPCCPHQKKCCGVCRSFFCVNDRCRRICLSALSPIIFIFGF